MNDIRVRLGDVARNAIEIASAVKAGPKRRVHVRPIGRASPRAERAGSVAAALADPLHWVRRTAADIGTGLASLIDTPER